MKQHTPGPYLSEQGRIYATIIKGDSMGRGAHNQQIACYDSSASIRPEEEHEPTGQLLAAAPELLEQLGKTVVALGSLANLHDDDMISTLETYREAANQFAKATQ